MATTTDHSKLTDIDPISNTPFLHQAFILHTFVPIRYVRRQKPFDDFTFVGCYPEGYRIPTVLTKTEKGDVIKKTTFDDNVRCMLVGNETVGPEGGKGESYFCLADGQYTQAGYVNLIPQAQIRQAKSAPAPKLTREKTNTMLQSEVSNKGSRSRTYLHRQNSIMLAADISEETEPLTPRSFSATPSKRKQKKRLPESVELLLALEFPEWPEVAAEWKNRERPFGWPGKRIEKKILAGGCHVTPGSHPQSVDPEVEWAYTFFQAESILNREAVSSVQRQCFIILNLLCMDLLEKKLLTFQQLKSVFYYVCETTDHILWRTNKAMCVHNMLDHLIKCVQDKNLPDYFIVKNNLIADTDLVKLQKDIEDIRKHAGLSLLQMTEVSTLVNIFPFYCNVPALFQPFLDDASDFVKSPDLDKSIRAMLTVTDQLCDAFYLDSGYQSYVEQFEEVAHYISSLISHGVSGFDEVIEYFIKPIQGDTEAAKHLEYLPQLLSQKNITLSEKLPPSEIWRPIRMCRVLISKFADKKRGSDMFDHLGCMYHSAAKVFDDHKKATLKSAEEAFSQALKKEDCGIGTFVDYGSFLCRTGKYQECLPVLKKVVDSESPNPQSINFYGKMEALVADQFIKREIDENEGLEILSVAYSYYLLADCYIHLKKKAELLKTLKHFEQVCKKANDANSWSLLGYTRMKINQYTKASACFQKVLELQAENKLVQQNIAVCKKHEESSKSDADFSLEKKMTKLNLWEM